MDLNDYFMAYKARQEIVLDATEAYNKALKLKPGDPLFIRGGTLFAKAMANLRDAKTEIDAQSAANKADREALKKIFQLTVDAAGVFAVAQEAIDPEYVPVPGAAVKYRGTDQCQLCGGTGQVLARPFVELTQKCLACGGDTSGPWCTFCQNTGWTKVIQRGSGPRRVEQCVDCGGSGHFDGIYSPELLATDGRVLSRALSRRITEHGEAVLKQMGNTPAR
jgi:hypothetical protein